MSIIDTAFLEQRSILYGLSSKGDLYAWDIAVQVSASFVDQPLSHQSVKVSVSQHQAKSLYLYRDYLYVCTCAQVVSILLSDFDLVMKKSMDRKGGNVSPPPMKKIHVHEGIGGMCLIQETDEDLQNHDSLLLGTNKGNIFKYSIEDEQMLKVCETDHEEITDLVAYKENLVMIAVGSQILIFNLLSNSIVEEILVPQKLPIKKISYFPSMNRFYTLHQNYILEWSIQLIKCLQYLTFTNSECVFLGAEEQLWIGGGRKQIKIVKKDGQADNLQTTMSNISTIKKTNKGLVIVGGSQGVVQIYKDECCVMVLFVWEG